MIKRSFPIGRMEISPSLYNILREHADDYTKQIPIMLARHVSEYEGVSGRGDAAPSSLICGSTYKTSIWKNWYGLCTKLVKDMEPKHYVHLGRSIVIETDLNAKVTIMMFEGENALKREGFRQIPSGTPITGDYLSKAFEDLYRNCSQNKEVGGELMLGL